MGGGDQGPEDALAIPRGKLRAPIRLHVEVGEETFCFAPRSALWRREAHIDGRNVTGSAIELASLELPWTSVSTAERRSRMGETPLPTGESGLAAEEE